MPVPHNKSEIVDGVQVLPQERVQYRVTDTVKVFTVKMRHHRDDQDCAVDIEGFIKGLHKHDMPGSGGDVMVRKTLLCRQLVVVLMVLLLKALSQDRAQQHFVEQITSICCKVLSSCVIVVLAWAALGVSVPLEKQLEVQEARRRLQEPNNFEGEER